VLCGVDTGTGRIKPTVPVKSKRILHAGREGMSLVGRDPDPPGPRGRLCKAERGLLHPGIFYAISQRMVACGHSKYSGRVR